MIRRHCFLILASDNVANLNALLEILFRSGNADIVLLIDRKFREAVLPRISTQFVTYLVPDAIEGTWASNRGLEAQERLAKVGLEHSAARYFTLLSDSCFPVRVLSDFYSFVEGTDKEFVFAIDAFTAQKRQKVNHLLGINFFSWLPVNPKNIRSAVLRKLVWFLHRIAGVVPRAGRGAFVRRGIRPYFGPNWWILSPPCVEYLLRPHDSLAWFRRFIRWSFAPDEFYVPTGVLNSPFRDRVYARDTMEQLPRAGDFTNLPHWNFNLRYSLWNVERAYFPKALDAEDAQQPLGNAFFARKVVGEPGARLRAAIRPRVEPSPP